MDFLRDMLAGTRACFIFYTTYEYKWAATAFTLSPRNGKH